MALLPLIRPPVCDPQAWLLQQPQGHLLKQRTEAAQWELIHFLLSNCCLLPPTTFHNSLETFGKYIMDSLMKARVLSNNLEKQRKSSSESSKGTSPYELSIKMASGVKTENEVFKPIFVCRVRQFFPS